MNAEFLNKSEHTDPVQGDSEISQTIDQRRIAQPRDPQLSLNATVEPTGRVGCPPPSQTSQQGHYINTKLDFFRERFLRYMKTVPIMTLGQLRENVLPRTLSADQIRAVLDYMDVVSMKKSFPTCIPTRSTNLSQEYSLHIKDIVEQVLTIGERVLKVPPQARIDCNPTSVHVSPEGSKSGRPDLNVMLAQPTSLSGCPAGAHLESVMVVEVEQNETSRTVYDVCLALLDLHSFN